MNGWDKILNKPLIFITPPDPPSSNCHRASFLV